MDDIEVLLKPAVPETLAIELVRRLYGLNVTFIKRMVSFDDQNFHIQVTDEYQNPHISEICEHGYTFKITNTMKTAQEGHFDAMHFVMLHLKSKGLTVPFPVRNLKGQTWTKEEVPLLNADKGIGHNQKLCGIHLLTFVPGDVVSSIEYSKDILFQWGSLLAKYHNATEDLDYPLLKTKSIFWNLEHIPDLKNYLEGMEESKETLVRSVLDKYHSGITKNAKNLRKGFIHGDFNENNVLVQVRGQSHLVDGILDLEDIHFGTYVWDIGVMLAYTMLECNQMDPLMGTGHALAGYLSIRSLTDVEMPVVKICIESRLCQSLVLCAHSYKKDPSNSYILTSSKTGWNRLEQIANTPTEELLKLWNEIRKSYTLKKA